MGTFLEAIVGCLLGVIVGGLILVGMCVIEKSKRK